MYKKFLYIFLTLFTVSCGDNANKTGWSLGTGILLGGTTAVVTQDPGATMAALATGLALGGHIGSKFDEVNTLKQEVLNLNADRERSKFSKIDEETNQPVTVEIEPTQTFQNDKFQQCREYNYAYTKNGETSHGRGYACLNEQGIWQELHHENG